MYGKYSVFNMMKLYRDNKPIIHAYLKGQSVEGYNHHHHDDDDDDHHHHKKKGEFAAFGGVGMFLIIMTISMVIWIWALICTMKNWTILPDWAKVLAIIGLIGIVGGPIMTIIVVYIVKNSDNIESGSKQNFSFGGCGSW
jgi:hypothetical protein